jgi:hypothetical protein
MRGRRRPASVPSGPVGQIVVERWPQVPVPSDRHDPMDEDELIESDPGDQNRPRRTNGARG